MKDINLTIHIVLHFMRLFQKISMKKTIAVALSSSSSITTHLNATEGLKFTVKHFPNKLQLKCSHTCHGFH